MIYVTEILTLGWPSPNPERQTCHVNKRIAESTTYCEFGAKPVA
jgi:hypothetical protein